MKYVNEQLDIDDFKKQWSVVKSVSGLATSKSDKIVLNDQGKFIDKPLEVATKAVFTCNFVGELNDKMRGEPRISYP